MKLGRIAPSRAQRRRALPLARYTTAPLPPAPPSCDQISGSEIGMFGNDAYGCCTVAGMANADAIWARIEGRKSLCTTAGVLAQYDELTGGVDSGLVEIDVLQTASSAGLKLGAPEPTRLAAWVTVPVHDREARSSLIALFGALYLGVALPLTAQSQRVWDSTGSLRGDAAPNSWGGHCLLEAGYDETNRALVTWGAQQLCTEAWIGDYCDEAYVLLDADRASAIGVAWDALLADLAAVPTS